MILAILGSRNHKGQTARAVDALLQGAADAGAAVERVFLPECALERCRQCNDNGWGTCRSEGKCVIEDNFAGIAGKIGTADAVVFATPVYFSDLSESLRAFLDRLRRITRSEPGKQGIVGKRAIGLCVAGGGGGGAPSCTQSLERVLATIGFDVVDLIPVRRQNLDFKLSILTSTGRWLASLEDTPKA